MSEARYPIIGLAIDGTTRALQAQLRYVNGKWKAILPDMTNTMNISYGPQTEQMVDLQDYLDAAQILFPPKKPRTED
jgi:hypothetical protein